MVSIVCVGHVCVRLLHLVASNFPIFFSLSPYKSNDDDNDNEAARNIQERLEQAKKRCN